MNTKVMRYEDLLQGCKVKAVLQDLGLPTKVPRGHQPRCPKRRQILYVVDHLIKNNTLWGSTAVPYTTNEIKSAKTGGEALNEAPCAMQRLEQIVASSSVK